MQCKKENWALKNYQEKNVFECFWISVCQCFNAFILDLLPPKESLAPSAWDEISSFAAKCQWCTAVGVPKGVRKPGKNKEEKTSKGDKRFNSWVARRQTTLIYSTAILRLQIHNQTYSVTYIYIRKRHFLSKATHNKKKTCSILVIQLWVH